MKTAKHINGPEDSASWFGPAVFIATIGGALLLLNKLGLLSGDKNPAGESSNEKLVEDVKKTINTKNLSRSETYYKQLAINQYEYLAPLVGNPFASVNGNIFTELQSLNADELKQVFVDFGYGERKLFNVAITLEAGNLFQWYTNQLNSSNLAKMQGIWQKTGLWVEPASTTSTNSSTYDRTGIITNPIVNGYVPKVGDKIRGKTAGVQVTEKAASPFSSGNKILKTLQAGEEMIINKDGRVNSYYTEVRIPKDYVPYYFETTGYLDLFNCEIIPQKSVKGLGFLDSTKIV